MVLAVLIPVAMIAGLVCALAIRLSSRGPVLFRQQRVGWGGEPFQILKFRTLVVGDHSPMHDPSAVTKVGRFLRRTSLDELPQLINIARGHMSFVGPRPTVASQVERYDDRQRERLAVRPGLTGLAQVSGRNTLPWTTRFDYDLHYVDGQSLRLDLTILAKTVRVVALGEGVTGHPADDPIVVGVGSGSGEQLAPVIDLSEHRHDVVAEVLADNGFDDELSEELDDFDSDVVPAHA